MEGLQRWRGKVAIVTGASSGIGMAIARALAGPGMKVAAGARTTSRLAQLQAELAAQHAELLPVTVDLRDEASILAMFETVRKRWGGVDVLVNNAGVGNYGALATGKTDEWRELLDVNVLAPAVCVREALKDMTGKPDAALINISSIAAHRVAPGNFAGFYSATKFALRAMTESLRAELASQKSPVKVAMISPAVTATEFHERATGNKQDLDFTPLAPEDVAQALLYILSAPRYAQVQDVLIRPIGQKL